MLDTLLAGIVHGNAYALVAIGLSLIFGVSNVVNFAQGSRSGCTTWAQVSTLSRVVE
ncbi:MAG: hypothetical protein JO057_11830 [Chloroflexi bacterium]|nr:hypothetical protein [Chloroflexota bacterium]